MKDNNESKIINNRKPKMIKEVDKVKPKDIDELIEGGKNMSLINQIAALRRKLGELYDNDAEYSEIYEISACLDKLITKYYEEEKK